MKRYIIIVAACLLAGCGKFLEESSQNELRPNNVNDLQQLIIGEAYPLSWENAVLPPYFLSYIELMTDNVENNPVNEETFSQGLAPMNSGEGPFTWRFDMYEAMGEAGVSRVDTYEHYYRRIKGCNVVLEELEEITGGVADKARLRGEALALRAYYYFMLVNLYGQPYNAPGVDVNTALGVPLVLSSSASDVYPTRATVGAVYASVEKDLLEAAPLLERYGQTKSRFKVTNLFAYHLLSRVYLYMEQWPRAIAYADSVIDRRPGLLNLATLAMPTGANNANVVNVYSPTSPEVIWTFSRATGTNTGECYSFYYLYPASSTMLPPYTVSSDLMNLYDYDPTFLTNDADLRPRMFYTKYTYPLAGQYVVHYGNKFGSFNDQLGGKGMRVAEAYLNRAEAYIQTGKQQEALRDLNTLRRHRYADGYADVQLSAIPDLLTFCLEERRRELSFEEHRWFDLRRHGMPAIKHTYHGEVTQAAREVTIPPERYVLPFSREVLDKNPSLIPNP
ncbi:MAG: RagB/SusD family nutrient uptake outer membrane protein [Odoribacteraceae bacterium]|nr:RagB/SusD family nutrient uptake outer membrane protein [Odoribacteraceae bacterium]